MSIIIKVIDKSKRKISNKFTMLEDDSMKRIKEKLFAANGINMYPPFIKLVAKEHNLYESTNVLDVINDGNTFEEWIDLTEDDLEFAKQLSLVAQGNTEFKDSVKETLEDINRKKTELYNKLKIEQENLETFYELAKTVNFDNEEYLDSKIRYKTMLIECIPNDFKSGTMSIFVILENIFNTIELDETIPLVVLGTQEEPLVKIYNNITNNTSINEIRSWIINVKKKTNMISYKKVKGNVIMMKYKVSNNKYLTINIQTNGLITAKYNDENGDNDIGEEEILEIIRKGIDYCVNVINKLSNTFTRSKRLKSTSESEIKIKSITGDVYTKQRINRNEIEALLNNEYIARNLFEIKDTISQDVTSMYANNTTNKENRLIVTIRDNKYMEGSIITVYNAEYKDIIYRIAKKVVLLNLGNEEDDINQTIREKSHIKNLRKQGVEISSIKCQKPRQPIISDKPALKNSYILEYKEKKYICPSKDYPYPGFTNENIVCCFKKNQKNREIFIRNTKSEDLEIQVSPSNFKIKIDNELETYAIKIVSEYNDGFDETNSMAKYYYYNSETNELVEITNDKIIDLLEQVEDNIWLPRVPLSKLINEPPKNACYYTPKMDKRDKCKHHEKNKIFGYNTSSYPCCFEKERNIVTIEKSRDKFDATKQHILKSDKILEYKRLGKLQKGFDKLFNEMIGEAGVFYRMGILQNKNAFLNAIVLATKLDKNVTEFKKQILEYMENNSEEYNTLNDGDIALKYKTLEEYKEMLKRNVIYWKDVIDIVQRMLKINVIIIDIPFTTTNSKTIEDYENSIIICYNNVKINKNLPNIILLKKKNTFEIIVNVLDDEIKSVFEPKKRISILLRKYYKQSCVLENELPENFKYSEMYTTKQLVKILGDTVTSQVVNEFNKVEYVKTKQDVLIPVKETGILKSLQKTSKSSLKLVDVETYIKVYKELEINVEILGISKNRTGLLTSFGHFVPILYTDNTDIKILQYNYYPDINKYLSNNKTLFQNKQVDYNKYIKKIRQEYFRIKKEISNEIDDDTRKRIESITKRVKTSRFVKMDEIIEEFNKIITEKNLFGKVPSTILKFMLSEIANEVINDNIENLLINNIVSQNEFDVSKTIVRNEESILTSLDKVMKWIKTYKRI